MLATFSKPRLCLTMYLHRTTVYWTLIKMTKITYWLSHQWHYVHMSWLQNTSDTKMTAYLRQWYLTSDLLFQSPSISTEYIIHDGGDAKTLCCYLKWRLCICISGVHDSCISEHWSDRMAVMFQPLPLSPINCCSYNYICSYYACRPIIFPFIPVYINIIIGHGRHDIQADSVLTWLQH